MTPGESAITIPEVAKILHVSTTKIKTMCALKEVPHVRLGRRVLFFRSDIEAWINAQMVGRK
jgi:excisionase family DNA binding protein